MPTDRRQEMRELIDTLDDQLDQRAARNEGFCPTRRQIYDDLFDEILRQVKHFFLVGASQSRIFTQSTRTDQKSSTKL